MYNYFRIFLAIIIVVLSYNYFFSNKSNGILLVTSGTGGDSGATTIISQQIKKYTNMAPILMQVDDVKAENFAGKSHIAVIGHDALANIDKFKENLKKEAKNLIIYSHLYNKDTVNAINDIKSELKATKIYVYITESNFQALKSSMSDTFNDEIQVVKIPLVINSYLQADNYENDVKAYINELRTISKHETVHIGGAYKNLNNQLTNITQKQILDAIRKLPIQGEELSLLLHPRYFTEFKSNDDYNIEKILDALKSLERGLKEHFKNIKIVNFYLPKMIYNKYEEMNANKNDMDNSIYMQPDYNLITYYLNSESEKGAHHEPQYISVDQYNAFSNFNFKVYPFLLNQDDEEQKSYLNEYSKLIKDEILENNPLTQIIADRLKS